MITHDAIDQLLFEIHSNRKRTMSDHETIVKWLTTRGVEVQKHAQTADTNLRNWISVKFENVQSDLNKNFDNIRMSAEHTEYLNKNYEVRKKELPPPPNTGS